MSLFAELKRRNVIRVAVAYVVAAWLLLQITDVLMSVLGLPEFVGKAVFLLLLIGFIPAVVFAWAFELTPEGLKRDTDVQAGATVKHQTARKLDVAVIAMLVLVGALVVYDRLVPEHPDATRPAERSVQEVLPPAAPVPMIDGEHMAASEAGASDTNSSTESGALPAPEEGDAITSVAVLPFANMSPDPDNEFFADGISEELLNVLVDVDGLRVPSRTSSFAFKGRNMDIRDIAAQLRVAHVLEGSVRKAGNRVRITAQLIDVSTDTHLWSETYDRELQDIFAIQDEIAGQIVDALRLALSIEDHRAPTENLEAYTLYLQGRELLRQREPEGLLRADGLLEEATRLDPGFADAWAAWAMVQVVLPGYLKEDNEKFLGPAERYAKRALDLQPDHAEAMLVLGQILNVTGEDGLALEQLGSLVARHPGHSTARMWFATVLVCTGYLQEAYEQIDAALRVDPVHGTVLDWHARIAHLAGFPERVEEHAARAIQLGRPQGRVPLHHAFLHDGGAEDLAPYLEGTDPYTWGWMLRSYPLREDPALLDDALAWADAAQQSGAGFIAEYMRSDFLLVAGPSGAFFQQVNRISSVDDTIDYLTWLKAAARHRVDPAMKAWVRDKGFLDLWRQRGWPDLCRPVGDDDFECDR